MKNKVIGTAVLLVTLFISAPVRAQETKVEYYQKRISLFALDTDRFKNDLSASQYHNTYTNAKCEQGLRGMFYSAAEIRQALTRDMVEARGDILKGLSREMTRLNDDTISLIDPIVCPADAVTKEEIIDVVSNLERNLDKYLDHAINGRETLEQDSATCLSSQDFLVNFASTSNPILTELNKKLANYTSQADADPVFVREMKSKLSYILPTKVTNLEDLGNGLACDLDDSGVLSEDEIGMIFTKLGLHSVQPIISVYVNWFRQGETIIIDTSSVKQNERKNFVVDADGNVTRYTNPTAFRRNLNPVLFQGGQDALDYLNEYFEKHSITPNAR